MNIPPVFFFYQGNLQLLFAFILYSWSSPGDEA
uniref:Uncharacterized protein n=1 Tax=Anguilla anguilla TaxID=7936 RepID=A0A0E9PGE1_ANGAN